jgi:site-specific DNA recombinase
MTNSQNLGTIEATNPVLAVAPLKEETEMLRATEKITALLPTFAGGRQRGR